MNVTDFRNVLAAHQCNPTGNGTTLAARCPAHEDNRASLSVTEGDGGKLLVHCHAGCTADAVVGALGLTLADLFATDGKRNGGKREVRQLPESGSCEPKTRIGNGGTPSIVATYDYRDESGTLLFQVCRLARKDFRQRRPDGNGGWLWSTKGVRRVLYRLPETLAAVARGDVVYIAEGEKDVAALVQNGFQATCNSGGAGKWRSEYNGALAGANVVVVADKDTPGRKHAAHIAEQLHAVAASVKVLELPDTNGHSVKDAFDFFAAGGTASDFKAIADTAPQWTPPKLLPDKVCTVVHSESAASAVVVASDPENDSELAFARRLAAALPPVKTVGNTWHMYRDGVWQPHSRDLLKPAALAILPEPVRTIRRAATLLEHVEAEKQSDPNGFRGFYLFDGGAVLLNTRNGLVRVTPEKLELLPHTPEHAFTCQTAAQFDPNATAPLFERVLGEVLPDPDDRALFQLCLGNFLYPDSRYEVAVCCYGEAGRGKSTVADPVATALGTGLVCRLSMSQVCDPRSYHLPKLRFAAVNLGTELTAADIAESGYFKTLVSGEPMEARPIYGEPFVMQTACKLWFLANSLPRFKYGTEAELRRTRFLRFDYQPPVKDVTLKARLAAEADGVFLFMLQGLQRLLTCAEIPIGGRESRAVHDRFRVSNDPVGAFVQCRCVLAPDVHQPKEHLRNAYAEFAQRHELDPGCAVWFFRALYERFPSLRETQVRVEGERVRHVAGIALRSSMTAAPVE